MKRGIDKATFFWENIIIKGKKRSMMPHIYLLKNSPIGSDGKNLIASFPSGGVSQKKHQNKTGLL